MREADAGYVRAISIAGFFVILCTMLIFAAILGPARRTNWLAVPEKESGAREIDLELGDPNCESDRGVDHGRGIPSTDEFDIFTNPWRNQSLEAITAPAPTHISVQGGSSRGLGDLSDPDILHTAALSPVEDPFADPLPRPPAPARPALISFQTLTSIFRLKARALDNGGQEDKGKARDVERNHPATADGDAAPEDLGALLAAATAARASPGEEEPFPAWLVTPKASAGPRGARFFEVDVDGSTVGPPDQDFVAMQHELLMRVPIPARPGMARGETWHPARDAGEGSSRPVVARNQTFI